MYVIIFMKKKIIFYEKGDKIKLSFYTIRYELASIYYRIVSKSLTRNF